MDVLPPGVYSPEELSNEQYHAHPAISKSDLDKISRSPQHYKHKKENPEPETPSMLRGRAVHAAILEPDLFAKEYAPEITPEDFPGVLRGTEEVQNAIITYNQELEGVATNQELREKIEQYNAGLPEHIKERTKSKKAAMLAERVPDLNQEELEELPAQELQALVDNHNDELPKPLKATKSSTREELLESLAAIDPEFAADQRAKPSPLGLDGTKADMVERLANACPDVLVWDAVRANYYEKHKGASLLPRDVYDRFLDMREAVMRHPGAATLLSLDGKAEHSIITTDPETGELVKIRPDWWLPGMFVDLKTTDDARPEAFARNSHKFGYDKQAAYYPDVMSWADVCGPIEVFVFIVVEDKPPHGVFVYYAGPRMIARGRHTYRENLNTLHQCRETDEWPGYPDTAIELELPAWADRIVDDLNLLHDL